MYCIFGTDGDGPTNWLERFFCNATDLGTFFVRKADLVRLKTAGIVTEFGAVSGKESGLQEIAYVANEADDVGYSAC